VGVYAHQNLKGSQINKNPLNVHPNGSKWWIQPALNKCTLGRVLRVLLLHPIARSGAERAKKGRTIPSVHNPNRKFLGSSPKSLNILLMFLHSGESPGWWSIPSSFLSSTCHRNNWVSFEFANRRWNLGIIGKYHNTFATGRFWTSISLSLSLYYEALLWNLVTFKNNKINKYNGDDN
jgi:hypothetical protein